MREIYILMIFLDHLIPWNINLGLLFYVVSRYTDLNLVLKEIHQQPTHAQIWLRRLLAITDVFKHNVKLHMNSPGNGRDMCMGTDQGCGFSLDVSVSRPVFGMSRSRLISFKGTPRRSLVSDIKSNVSVSSRSRTWRARLQWTLC